MYSNILCHSSFCNEYHKRNLFAQSPNYRVSIWLMLLFLFTSPVFSHFLGITLIMFIFVLSANPHLSTYCYSYPSMTGCWWYEKNYDTRRIYHISLTFHPWVKCLSSLPYCSHLNANSKRGEITTLCTNYPPYSKIF